eukprot:g1839.t1
MFCIRCVAVMALLCLPVSMSMGGMPSDSGILEMEAITPTMIARLDKAIELFSAHRLHDAVVAAEAIVADHPTYFYASFLLAVALHDTGNHARALEMYDRTLKFSPDHKDALVTRGMLLRQMGRYEDSLQSFRGALQLFPEDARVANGLGLAHHYLDRYEAAIQWYDRAIELAPDWAEPLYNKGVSVAKVGNIALAGQLYFSAIEAADGKYSEASLNLASLHHRTNNLDMALRYYELSIVEGSSASPDLVEMARTNMGVVHLMKYDGKSAMREFRLSREIILRQLEEADSDKEREDARASLTANRAHISRLRTAMCDWQNYDEELLSVVADVELHELAKSRLPSLLPFDLLLLPVSQSFQLRIARAHSSQYEVEKFLPELLPYATATASHGAASDDRRRPLRLGYISYDFNDHRLFVHHDRDRVYHSALSYGKNDKSVFRKRIESVVDEFVNMAEWNHTHSSVNIASRKFDILYDLQSHTRGNRVEILARHPAPIQVSMLIYPGPSGSRWLEYLIADAIVAPPEAAVHYLSKLVYMPDSYQVNFYAKDDYDANVQETALEAERSESEGARWDDAKMMDRRERLLPSPLPPASATFVFCNFNKNDKLDPESFSTWMAALRAVPGSVLWLLDGGNRGTKFQINERLLSEAAAAGVHPSRILFAPRRAKFIHLARMTAADLFVDSFIYGAHSTATDALRGGLPVLTLRRKNFASRVATSLLENVRMPELSVNTITEFENSCLRLAAAARAVPRGGRKVAIARAMRKLLSKDALPKEFVERRATRSQHDADAFLFADGSFPLFDIARYTRSFERSAELLHEVRASRGAAGPMHVVVGG